MVVKKGLAVGIIIALVVVLTVPSALIGAAVLLKDNGLYMAVISDVHLLSSEQMGDKITPALEKQEAKGQKMLFLSEAILMEAVDRVIEEKREVLLLSGDLTDDGGKASHEAVARELKRAEENGVRCFVINGNHDINNRAYTYTGDTSVATENVGPEDFSRIYADFGYSEAINRDPNTLSYAADLDKNYRLVAIDGSYYEQNADGSVTDRHSSKTSDELLKWTEERLKEAAEEEKRIIVMLHFPIAGHMTELVESNGLSMDKREDFKQLFFDYGVKFVFSGHLHNQDISIVKDDGGRSFYDVETAALSNYPMPIRYFSGKKDAETVTTSYVTSIKEKYIPSCVPEETKREILTDLPAYSEKVVYRGLKIKVMSKLDKDLILSLLSAFGLDKNAEETSAFADDIRENLIVDYFDTPIYSDGSGKSVEDICTGFGISLPNSSYDTIWSVAIAFVKANYRGNEGYKITDTEGTLLKYGLYTMFYKIADYDLFGKINAQNPEVNAIDLMPSMRALFVEGKLNMVSNNLLGTIGSMEKLQKLMEKAEDKLPSFVASIITGIDLSDSAQIMATLKSVLNLLDTLKMDWTALLGSAGSYVDLVKSIGLKQYFDFDNGQLLFGDVVEKLLFGEIGENLITDKAPRDDTVAVLY